MNQHGRSSLFHRQNILLINSCPWGMARGYDRYFQYTLIQHRNLHIIFLRRKFVVCANKSDTMHVFHWLPRIMEQNVYITMDLGSYEIIVIYNNIIGLWVLWYSPIYGNIWKSCGTFYDLSQHAANGWSVQHACPTLWCCRHDTTNTWQQICAGTRNTFNVILTNMIWFHPGNCYSSVDSRWHSIKPRSMQCNIWITVHTLPMLVSRVQKHINETKPNKNRHTSSITDLVHAVWEIFLE